MSHFQHPKSRQQLRLTVQLGAGLLAPMWVAPALAQGVAAITPSANVPMAPRDEREKLAPAVMQAEASQAAATANQLAWSESLKRMSEAEADDPKRALAAYKRFFNERTMSPALGVEVGVKIAQLRSKLGDDKGALQTCDVLAIKYADEPTAALLSLQKARVLMESKQLAQASECVNEAMPELVALGPSRYQEISDLLLKLVQANLDSGDADGKERARSLCVGVEEIYLRWLKGGTVSHTWQMFEVLKKKYEIAGGQKRAEELLPKAVDVLLQMKATPQNVEGADVSLIAARWLLKNRRVEEANALYAKVPSYNNTFVSEIVVLDQVRYLCEQGEVEAALQMANPLLRQVSNPDKVRVLASISYGYYVRGDYDQSINYSNRVLSESKNYKPFDMEVSQGLARANLQWAEQWKSEPLLCEPGELKLSKSETTKEETIIKRFLIFSHRCVSLTATCNWPGVRVSVGDPGGTNQYTTAQQLNVLIDPKNLPTSEAKITIRSEEFPEFPLTIPFQVEATEPR